MRGLADVTRFCPDAHRIAEVGPPAAMEAPTSPWPAGGPTAFLSPPAQPGPSSDVTPEEETPFATPLNVTPPASAQSSRHGTAARGGSVATTALRDAYNDLESAITEQVRGVFQRRGDGEEERVHTHLRARSPLPLSSTSAFDSSGTLAAPPPGGQSREVGEPACLVGGAGVSHTPG
jgi:hypothetical protein